MIKHYGWTRDVERERYLARRAPDMVRHSPVFQCWQQQSFIAIVGHEVVVPAIEGTITEGLRWHLSISHASRYPTWDEIKAARYGLIPDEAWMVQVLPPKGAYLNQHPNCFHLWEVPRATVPVAVPL